MLRVDKSVAEKIVAHARRELPIEACGYLAGSDGTATVHYEMTNVDASAEHFSFNVKEQFAVLKDVRAKGLKVLAVYHSHPSTPARPSAEDMALAHDPGVSYVIVSFADGKEEIRSFRIAAGTAEAEALELCDAPEIRSAAR